MSVYTYFNEGLILNQAEKDMIAKINEVIDQISDKSVQTTGVQAVHNMKSDPAFRKLAAQKLQTLFDLSHFPLPFNYTLYKNEASRQHVVAIKGDYAYNFILEYYVRAIGYINKADFKAYKLDEKIPIEIFQEAIRFVSKTKHYLKIYKNKVEFFANSRDLNDLPRSDFERFCDLIEQKYGDKVTVKRSKSLFSATFIPKK